MLLLVLEIKLDTYIQIKKMLSSYICFIVLSDDVPVMTLSTLFKQIDFTVK